MKLAVQEQVLPAGRLQAKWEIALAWGFDAIELRGQGGHALRDRLPELMKAKDDGVVMPTVCVEMEHFIGDFDPGLRADALANMTTQLQVIGALGGVGAMTPAAWRMYSRRLARTAPPRTPEGDREVLLEALGNLGEVAGAEGVSILLEPLNRYEEHMVNTLAQAAELAAATGLAGVRLGADTYHMNIEEADPLGALRRHADRLGHVQLSDSNRLEPGKGHVDWVALLRCLRDIGYDGYLAFECQLSGPAAEVLPRSAAMLKAADAMLD